MRTAKKSLTTILNRANLGHHHRTFYPNAPKKIRFSASQYRSALKGLKAKDGGKFSKAWKNTAGARRVLSGNRKLMRGHLKVGGHGQRRDSQGRFA